MSHRCYICDYHDQANTADYGEEYRSAYVIQTLDKPICNVCNDWVKDILFEWEEDELDQLR